MNRPSILTVSFCIRIFCTVLCADLALSELWRKRTAMREKVNKMFGYGSLYTGSFRPLCHQVYVAQIPQSMWMTRYLVDLWWQSFWLCGNHSRILDFVKHESDDMMSLSEAFFHNFVAFYNRRPNTTSNLWSSFFAYHHKTDKNSLIAGHHS